MADIRGDLSTLRDPSTIKDALFANSPYVLQKAFQADPTIRRLIAAGEKVVPLIAEEVREAEHLDEITLSAYAFIVQNVKADAAPQIFGAPFRKSLENPGPFFVNFAAHAIQSAFQRSTNPKVDYSHSELIETLNMLP